jgi:hypothetical protein
MFGINI